MEVPIPTRVLSLPEFGKMALVKAPVDVAQCVSAAPPPEPQATPVPPTRPAEILRQPSAIPLTVAEPNVPAVAKRLVLEAVVLKRLVVVALVPVALTKVKFCKVDEPVESKLARVAREEELMMEAKRLVEKKSVEVAAVVVE